MKSISRKYLSVCCLSTHTSSRKWTFILKRPYIEKKKSTEFFINSRWHLPLMAMQRNSNFLFVAKGQRKSQSKSRSHTRICSGKNIMIFRRRCTRKHEQKLHFNDLPIFKSQFALYFAKHFRKIVPSPTADEKRKINLYSVFRKKNEIFGKWEFFNDSESECIFKIQLPSQTLSGNQEASMTLLYFIRLNLSIILPFSNSFDVFFFFSCSFYNSIQSTIWQLYTIIA